MSLIEDLKNAVKDLSELSVQTFTGELTADVLASGTDKTDLLDWSKLVAAAKTTQGKVSLAASAKYKIDGDADLFISSSITSEIREAHMAAVKAGWEVREGLIRLFADVVGIDRS